MGEGSSNDGGRGPVRRPRRPGPIPLDGVSLLAGIGPGLKLEADPLPAGVAGNAADEEAVMGLDELARMLRCDEPTVRRLIRTEVLRPVEVDGALCVRRVEAEAYRRTLAGHGGKTRDDRE